MTRVDGGHRGAARLAAAALCILVAGDLVACSPSTPTSSTAPPGSPPISGVDSRPPTWGVLPAMPSPPVERWQATEQKLFDYSDTYRQRAPLTGQFFPGEWNPANGGRWITIASSTTATRVRSVKLDSGTQEWDAILDSPAAHCAVNAGPDMVCATDSQLVLLDIKTGTQTSTLPVAGVKNLALSAAGDIYVASWDNNPAGTSEPSPTTALNVKLQRLDPAGTVQWSSSGTIQSDPSDPLQVTLVHDAVFVSSDYTGACFGRTAAAGQLIPGLEGAGYVSWWGDRLTAASTENWTTRVINASGEDLFTVPGIPASPGNFLITRDVSSANLPLVTDSLASGGQTLRAFDDQGKQLWESSGETLRAICGGATITTSDQQVTARDAHNGTIRWTQHLTGAVACDGPRALILDNDGPSTTESGTLVVTAVDLTSGRQAWQASIPGHAFHYASDTGLILTQGTADSTYALYR